MAFRVSIPLWFDWKIHHQITIHKYFCFNSTLVRLEALKPVSHAPVIRFQFHFGSIGRQIQTNTDAAKFVSIPLWFDWKLLTKDLNDKLALFQFHFGSIGSQVVHWAFLWRGSFQFHFGSIGRTYQDATITSVQRFNSTLVRLEDFPHSNIRIKKGVSIPLWFDWKNTGKKRSAVGYVVSIPLWFDWK